MNKLYAIDILENEDSFIIDLEKVEAIGSIIEDRSTSVYKVYFDIYLTSNVIRCLRADYKGDSTHFEFLCNSVKQTKTGLITNIINYNSYQI